MMNFWAFTEVFVVVSLKKYGNLIEGQKVGLVSRQNTPRIFTPMVFRSVLTKNHMQFIWEQRSGYPVFSIAFISLHHLIFDGRPKKGKRVVIIIIYGSQFESQNSVWIFVRIFFGESKPWIAEHMAVRKSISLAHTAMEIMTVYSLNSVLPILTPRVIWLAPRIWFPLLWRKLLPRWPPKSIGSRLAILPSFQ